MKRRQVWLNDYETLEDARLRIGHYVDRYHDRPHSSLNYRTPNEVARTWEEGQTVQKSAARNVNFGGEQVKIPSPRLERRADRCTLTIKQNDSLKGGTMERTGIAFWGGMRADELISCVQTAESARFESAWIIESYADVFGMLGAVAVATNSIRLGTAVTTVFTRNPINIAIGAVTIDAVSKGRFRLGLGIGHRELHEVRDDVERARPLSFKETRMRLRETTELVRAVVRAAKDRRIVSFHGELFSVQGYQPWLAAYRDSIPIYLAALSDGTKRLVGELADGVLPISVPLERVPRLLELVHSAASEAQRDAAEIDIGCLFHICVSDDRNRALEALRRDFVLRIASMRFYRRYFRWLGYGDLVDLIVRAAAAGSLKDVGESVTADFLEAVGAIAGPPEYCAERLDIYRRAGIALPIAYLFHPDFTRHQALDAGAAIRGSIDALGQTLR